MSNASSTRSEKKLISSPIKFNFKRKNSKKKEKKTQQFLNSQLEK